MKRTGAGRRRAQGKPIGKRRRAREMAVQMLYQLEVGGCGSNEVFDHFDLADFVSETELAKSDEDAETEAPKLPPKRLAEIEAAFAYAQTLVAGVLEHAESVDERIRQHAENWRLERMPMIDRNILRVAVFEMLFQDGVPKVVILDEAIELAKKFGAENSSRFVNGLLDGVLKSSRKKSKRKTSATNESPDELPDKETAAVGDRTSSEGTGP